MDVRIQIVLTQVIQELKVFLSKEPFDVGHDVAHRCKVWENCAWIIDCEGLKKIDRVALQIAAFGHDLERGSETHDKLVGVMKKYKCSQELIDKVIAIINEHSHDDTQTRDESNILFDADKLEYVGLLRWQMVIQAESDGYVQPGHTDKYKKLWNERIDGVQKGLHFECTREKFAEELKNFISWAEKEGIYKDGKLV